MSYERPKLNVAVVHRVRNMDIVVFMILWSIRLGGILRLVPIPLLSSVFNVIFS